MHKKPLARNDSNFYLPGEEINLQRQDVFSSWDNRSSSGYMAKGRILFASVCAFVAYFLVALRLLHTCIFIYCV